MFGVKKSEFKLLRQVINTEVPELRRMAARRSSADGSISDDEAEQDQGGFFGSFGRFLERK